MKGTVGVLIEGKRVRIVEDCGDARPTVIEVTAARSHEPELPGVDGVWRQDLPAQRELAQAVADVVGSPPRVVVIGPDAARHCVTKTLLRCLDPLRTHIFVEGGTDVDEPAFLRRVRAHDPATRSGPSDHEAAVRLADAVSARM